MANPVLRNNKNKPISEGKERSCGRFKSCGNGSTIDSFNSASRLCGRAKIELDVDTPVPIASINRAMLVKSGPG